MDWKGEKKTQGFILTQAYINQEDEIDRQLPQGGPDK